MNKWKNVVQNTKQLFQSPEEVEGNNSRSSSAVGFSTAKRRLMHMAGKNDGSADSDYEHAKAHYLEWDKLVKAVKSSAEGYLQNARNLTFISNEMARFATTAYVNTDANMGIFSDRLQALDGQNRVDFEAYVRTNIIDPLDAHIMEFMNVSSMMRSRELLKVDLDARTKKLQTMRTSNTDPNKVMQKEDKVRRTREALTKSTEDVYAKFDECDRLRYGGWLANIINCYVTSQRDFFRKSSVLLDAVPPMAATNPPLNSTPRIYAPSGAAAASMSPNPRSAFDTVNPNYSSSMMDNEKSALNSGRRPLPPLDVQKTSYDPGFSSSN